jgi:hypothetical protein
LKRDCFYYYLLKDDASQDGDMMGDKDQDERSRRFAESRCLSKTWRVFMDGYWALDHGLWEVSLLPFCLMLVLEIFSWIWKDFVEETTERHDGNRADKQDAITNLTNPLITSINFPSEIISTLSQLAPSNQAMGLIHKFLLTRLPDESTPETDLHLYTVSLAASQSVSSAFSFIRSLPTDKQGSLRDGIWAWAFGAPRIPCGLPQGKATVNQIAIKEILHLPLLPAEDDHLLQFLLSPPRLSSQSLSLLHDLVTLRLIHQGKYAESLQLDKELAGSGGSEESRQKRREMVREFIAILPEAQRRVLAVDGEYVSSRREGNVNGYMEIDAPKATNNNVQTAPTPTKQVPAFPLEPTQTPTIPTPKAATPIQSRVVSSTNSPFSGPPRFASTSNNQVNSPQIARVLSGSPFTLPMSRGANAVRSASSSGMRTPTMGSRDLPIPRPKVRPVIQDEEETVQRNTRKRGRESDVDMDMEQEQAQEHEQEQESVQENGVGEGEIADTEMEVSKDVVESEQEQDEEQEETQAEPVPEKQPTPPAPTPRTRRAKPPPPPPATSTTPKRTTRKSTIPPPSPLHARIPGSFDLSIPQSVPEDKALQSKPRPARKTKTKEAEPPRSRMTRSVSRAISLDMEASPPAPAASAAKRARSRRGSTATVASVAEEEISRRGASPTPSTRSRVGSQTPRKSTRTRK